MADVALRWAGITYRGSQPQSWKRAFPLSEHLSEILWNGLKTKATLKLSQFCKQSKYFQPLWLLLPIAAEQQREVLHNIEAPTCLHKKTCLQNKEQDTVE